MSTESTFESLWQMINSEAAVSPVAARARLFYTGDHWQAGDAWGGPLGDPDDKQSLLALMRDIARIFTPYNAVAEIVERQTDAVVGRDPDWQLISMSPGGQANADDSWLATADTALVDWYDQSNILAALKRAANAAALDGVAYARLFIPPQFLDLVQGESGQRWQFPPMATLPDALALINLEILPAGQAAIWIDAENRQRYAARRYTIKNQRYIELMTVRRFGRLDSGQLQPLPRPLTDISVYTEGPEGLSLVESASLDLGGRLLIERVKPRAALITEPVILQQIALNAAITMGQHNLLGAGLSERALLNVNWPAEKINDAGQPDGYRLRPAKYKSGLGTVHNLVGLPTYSQDPMGTHISGYTQPGIWTHEPSPPDTFHKVEYQHYSRILTAAGQLFAVLAGDAMASGESRQQALADFKIKLADIGGEMAALVRWLLGATLALAAQALPDAQRQAFIRFRVNATMRLRLPPAGSDARRVNLEQFKERMISQHEALVREEIDDPDAEIERIRTEEVERSEAASAGLAANLLATIEQANTGVTSTSLMAGQPLMAPEPVALPGDSDA